MVKDYQNGVIAQLLEAIVSQVNFDGEPISNIGDILLSILEKTPYDKEPKSVLAELFLKLKNKLEGDPFTPYDKEPKSVLAEILLSILNETEYTDPPTSRIGELLLELKAELESYAEITTSGPIASFTTSLIKPLVNLTAYFKATQESGTPTPQSPKAINGVSSVTVTQADENMQAVVSEVINLGGTYYGGYVSQDKDGKRELVVTHELKNLKDLDVKYSDNSGAWENWLFFSIVSDKKQGKEIKCSHYEVISPFIYSMGNNSIGVVDWSNYVYWRDDTYTSVNDFKQNAPDINILVELAEPFTVALSDGEPIVTLNGVNNIYNDSGDTSVTYLALISDNITRGAKMRAVKKAEKIKLIEQEKQPVIIDPIDTKETKDTKAEG